MMNFFTSSAAAQPAAAAPNAGTSAFGRILLRRNDQAADDLESQPLSPRMDISPDSPDLAATGPPEMSERRQAPRFPAVRRPTVPSMFRFSSSTQATTVTTSTGTRWPGHRSSRLHAHPNPRPSSSHYPDDDDDEYDDINGLDSPKYFERPYSVNLDLPSTRLHLPGLQRTWTQGSNGPPTGRNPNGHDIPPVPSIPSFLVTAPPRTAARAGRLSSDDPEDDLYAEDDEHDRAGPFADPAESQLADMAEDGRRRRDRSGGSGRSKRHRHGHRRTHQRGGGVSSTSGHRHRRRRHGASGTSGSGSSRRRHGDDLESGRSRSSRPLPKNFLFCFPWVKSRRVRSQILQCFVSGLFLVLMLTVYLALTVTKNIVSSEFTVLLILIILFVTIFFCHGLIRLFLLIKRPQREEERRRNQLPQVLGPGGYAVPREPIRVVLARDEEAAGIASETTKINPPAYGLWRESVRVDPNRIYWKRNSQAREGDEEIASVAEDLEEGAESDSSSSSAGERMPDGTRRPPSYASEDGVSYIVEARPRSMAPPDDMALPTHPSEAGRVVMPLPLIHPALRV